MKLLARLVALWMCAACTFAAQRALPVFFTPDSQTGYRSRGDRVTLRFGRGEVRAGSVAMRFGDGRAEPEAVDPLPFHVNTFTGDRPAEWRTGMPAYAGIRYRDVYPGIVID